MNKDLNTLREEIDRIDRSLVSLLEQRMGTASQIAEFKRENHLPVLDQSREDVKIRTIAAQCSPENSEYICRIFGSIISESRCFQTAILEDRHE